MSDKQSFNDYLAKANDEYKSLYCIYKEIIEVVDILEIESRKRLKKLSNIDDGLDKDSEVEKKTEKQTRKFTKAIFKFNENINGLLNLFNISADKTFSYFRKLHSICKENEEKEIDCLKEVNKRLRLMNLIIQKFLNKILRLQAACNIFPNLSEDLQNAKATYEANLKKTVITLRNAITEIKEIVDGIDKVNI